jgi:DNA-binding response OmpR family regulator
MDRDSPADPRPKRILVVDDNRDWADALALLLRAEGHTVITAYDGRQALDAAREFLPQIVVLDIRMPHMTGFEAARALSRLAAGARPMLIAISGWPGEAEKLRATMAGFDHYFGKPVASSDILDLVKRAQ